MNLLSALKTFLVKRKNVRRISVRIRYVRKMDPYSAAARQFGAVRQFSSAGAIASAADLRWRPSMRAYPVKHAPTSYGAALTPHLASAMRPLQPVPAKAAVLEHGRVPARRCHRRHGVISALAGGSSRSSPHGARGFGAGLEVTYLSVSHAGFGNATSLAPGRVAGAIP